MTQTSESASTVWRRVAQIAAIAACLLTIVLAVLLAESPKPGLMFGIYPYKPFMFLSGPVYLSLWACYWMLSPQPLRRSVAHCLLFTGSLATIIGVFEMSAALRMVDYRTVFGSSAHGINKFDPFRDPTWRIDPELIHIRRPNAVIEGSTIGNLAAALPHARPYPVHATYDDRGFRNERTLDRANVVIIGDSFVEAGLVATTEIASNRLARLLNADVVNLGQCAYGPQQELVVMRRYAMSLQPDIVLWFFFEGNDLSNIRGYEEKIGSWAATVNAHDGFSQRSFVKNVFHRLARVTGSIVSHPSDHRTLASLGRIRLKGGSHEEMHFLYPGCPLSESDHQSLATAQELLCKAHSMAAEADSQFVLVFVPTKFRVYEGLCEFSSDVKACNWHSNDFPDRLAEWCREQAMHHVDLTPALRGAAERGELVYLLDDTHWSSRGNKVAAGVVADFIQRQQWLSDKTSVEAAMSNDSENRDRTDVR